MKKRDKRGQFYLLIAIIFVAITLSFITISNYSKKRESVVIYDLADELGIEGGEVLTYGTYNNQNLKGVFDDFTRVYTTYAGEDKSFYFVFGDRNEVTVAGYQEITTGTISVDTGSGSPSTLEIKGGLYNSSTHSPQGNKITVTINGADYEFDLKLGENFYFIISQEVGGEKFISRG